MRGVIKPIFQGVMIVMLEPLAAAIIVAFLCGIVRIL